MKLNPIPFLFGRAEPSPPVLLAVTPPKTGERTLLGVENMLSFAVPEPFSLELAGDADGVTLLVRCRDNAVVRQQVSAHYPQARVLEVSADEDPLRLKEGEQAWSMTLKTGGPDYVPLRTFKDDDLLDPGSDPLIAPLGALSDLHPGERVVARLLLRSLGPDWSQPHLEKVMGQQGPEARQSSEYAERTKALQTDGVNMAVLGAAALAALRGYLWVQNGETWKAVLLGAGILLGLTVAGWARWRWKKARSRVYDPLLIKEKVSRLAFDAQLQVTAILPREGARERARDLLGAVAAAYGHYDHPAGARFKAGKARPIVPTASLHPAGSGLFGKRTVLGVREVAALWHPPGARDETPLVARSGARVLLPAAKSTGEGAPVGDTTAGMPREIRFPEDLVGRHHLYVARTRMGKSTLMHHLVAHKMMRKAEGRDTDAIVVVDPHADLVNGLLEQVPESLVSQVRLIDLADVARAPGINLLDARVFTDRDRAADSIVRIAKGLWDQWGPRMHAILDHTAKTLHEANSSMGADEQHTILEGLRLLSDPAFRRDVLARVDDPYVLGWWANDFGSWHPQYRAEALAPVQTRLSYYASSHRARAILGQPRSTIDLRRTILDGGMLLVSTAQGTAGREVAALVGASLLNLVDAVIREQEGMPPEQRRGALVVVDEMQSIPGVDYEAMLSELGKFGASLILATQSLAKLDDLSPTMRDTVLANIGCIAAFQVSGSDARELVWEFGRDRVSEEDIVSQPAHHCYVRASVGKDRLPAFSMAVRPPQPGNPETAARIRTEAAAYTTSAEEIKAREGKEKKRVEERRAELDAIEAARMQRQLQSGQPQPKPRRQRKKRPRDPKASGPDDTGLAEGRPEDSGNEDGP